MVILHFFKDIIYSAPVISEKYDAQFTQTQKVLEKINVVIIAPSHIGHWGLTKDYGALLLST